MNNIDFLRRIFSAYRDCYGIKIIGIANYSMRATPFGCTSILTVTIQRNVLEDEDIELMIPRYITWEEITEGLKL